MFKSSKGIYLPISDNEEDFKGNPKDGRSKIIRRGIFRHPHLMILLLLILTTIVIGIGMFMFNTGSKGEFAVKDVASVSPLILVSIDGFRYDYLRRGLTPNLKILCKKGIYGPMKPQFPSYTFPNHFSLVTGLYPESHGIVGNAFYDPKLGEYFSYNNQKDLKESKWWLAEPIWNSIQKFGMKSATMFWPGSESAIFGTRPNYYKTYDGAVSTEDRVDQVLEWLDFPETKKPKFISMYLSLVDDAGHMFGPDSKELNETLKEIDFGIGRLINGLKEREIDNLVNLIVVSDHGMVEIKDEEKFHIYLDDLIPEMKERLQWVDYGPMASIIPMEGEEDAIMAELRSAQRNGIPFMAFKRDELPPEYHYTKSDRIAPIVLIAKKGYVIDFRGGVWVPRGAHGYDPNLPEMQALLIATGPQFRDAKYSAGRRINRALKGVSNLDVYPLLMTLLKIPPSPNNGTLCLVNMIK